MKTELIRSQLTDAQRFVDEACAKAKMWKKALALLEEMEVKGIAPTDVTYRLDTFFRQVEIPHLLTEHLI